MDNPAPLKAPPKTATPAWAEGYAARPHGFEREDNPYLDGDDGREDDWDEGWFEANEQLARSEAPVGISATTARDMAKREAPDVTPSAKAGITSIFACQTGDSPPSITRKAAMVVPGRTTAKHPASA